MDCRNSILYNLMMVNIYIVLYYMLSDFHSFLKATEVIFNNEHYDVKYLKELKYYFENILFIAGTYAVITFPSTIKEWILNILDIKKEIKNYLLNIRKAK